MDTDLSIIVEKLLKEQKRQIIEQVRPLLGEAAAQAIEEIAEINDWEVIKKYLCQ